MIRASLSLSPLSALSLLSNRQIGFAWAVCGYCVWLRWPCRAFAYRSQADSSLDSQRLADPNETGLPDVELRRPNAQGEEDF